MPRTFMAHQRVTCKEISIHVVREIKLRIVLLYDPITIRRRLKGTRFAVARQVALPLFPVFQKGEGLQFTGVQQSTQVIT